MMCCSRRELGLAEDILEHSEQTAQAPLAASKQQLAGQSAMQHPNAQASDVLHADGEPVVKQIRQAASSLPSGMLPCALSESSLKLTILSLMPHQTAQHQSDLLLQSFLFGRLQPSLTQEVQSLRFRQTWRLLALHKCSVGVPAEGMVAPWCSTCWRQAVCRIFISMMT